MLRLFHFVFLAAVVCQVQSDVTYIGNMYCVQYNDVKCPDNKYVEIFLYTRANQTEMLDVAANNISKSHFNPEHPTKIIVHGYMDKSRAEYYANMKSEYLAKGEHNVIMVEWRFLARGPDCFKDAYNNSKHVGECTRGLITLLRDSYKMKDVHLIGHGLGVSVIVAAVRGIDEKNILDPKLPRFTALDPPRPTSNARVRSPEKSDADFLDVIHTSYASRESDGYGWMLTKGHVDFFVNGPNQQPGCATKSSDPKGKICRHIRSILLYTESINSEKGFYGTPCTWNDSRHGNCIPGSRNILMGDGVLNTTKGIVHVPTAAQSPFALGKSD